MRYASALCLLAILSPASADTSPPQQSIPAAVRAIPITDPTELQRIR